ncbi:covalently-linked cell wall protein [Pyricularia oryzae Y34]|uniref:Covalently-linked cell wall protein n=2 Tax=Pyricularia oryzae TaxID=318829 RepID=A0AA97P674_PYRO3|nr:covalently-linked cell wall protein [Pyricularia oryzae Y34]
MLVCIADAALHAIPVSNQVRDWGILVDTSVWHLRPCPAEPITCMILKAPSTRMEARSRSSDPRRWCHPTHELTTVVAQDGTEPTQVGGFAATQDEYGLALPLLKLWCCFLCRRLAASCAVRLGGFGSSTSQGISLVPQPFAVHLPSPIAKHCISPTTVASPGQGSLASWSSFAIKKGPTRIYKPLPSGGVDLVLDSGDRQPSLLARLLLPRSWLHQIASLGKPYKPIDSESCDYKLSWVTQQKEFLFCWLFRLKFVAYVLGGLVEGISNQVVRQAAHSFASHPSLIHIFIFIVRQDQYALAKKIRSNSGLIRSNLHHSAATTLTMQSYLLGRLAVLLGIFAAAVNAQGVTADISPPTKAPTGCQTSFPGTFEVTVIPAKLAKRDGDSVLSLQDSFQKRRECGHDGVLVVTLSNSVTKDALSRTGYIASNYQFQFDKPAQAGALYTAGFSLCPNGLMALGNSTQFWQCKSGDFWNLYDRNWAPQCDPVVLKAMPCGPASGASSPGGMGQVVGTNIVTTTIVRPIADGQPQVITTVVPIAMCQIGDGQVQAHTTPCASLSAPLESAPRVSQITDGQIQVPPPTAGPATTPAGATPTPAPTPTPTGGMVTPSARPSGPPVASPPPAAPPMNAGAKTQWCPLAWAMSSVAVYTALFWL